MPTDAYPMARADHATDAHFMARALALAARGGGWVSPNPQVGCVIVRDGQLLGEGWHARYGAPHAEREALAACQRAGADPAGATAYVTLEPCAHTGKQPPCCEALIEARVARVVVGSADPNPLVAGKGIAALRAAGIEVTEGVMCAECDAINRAFFHFITTGRPLVVAKYAMTLDGRIATRTGASQWITGEAARRRVHEDRARAAAIMVGVGTVLADDPLLTARDVEGAGQDGCLDACRGTCQSIHQPTRIVCDTHLRTPLESQLVHTAQEWPTLIATSADDPARVRAFEDAGCVVLIVPPGPDGHLSLSALIEALGQQAIQNVIVEGGSALFGSLFDERLVDRVQVYIAPKVFGGASAPTPIAGTGVACPSDAAVLEGITTTTLGSDILVEGDVRYADTSKEAPCSQAS